MAKACGVVKGNRAPRGVANVLKTCRLCGFKSCSQAFFQEVGLWVVVRCHNFKSPDMFLKEDSELCCSLHLVHVLGLVLI